MSSILRDVARHKERLREAIRQALPDVIAQSDIITAPSGRQLKVPVRFLDEPRFRVDRPQPGAGQHSGAGLPGNAHIDPTIEVGLSIEELADILFHELRLPNLKPRMAADEDPDVRVEGITRQGPTGRLDKRRTLLEHARAGGLWHESQFRYRNIVEKQREASRAAVVFVRDYSGSMDDDKRYRVRVSAFWLLRWLRRQYLHAEPAFVLHDVAAQEVDEHTFFEVGHGGGTEVSSGLRLAAEILDRRYPVGQWCRYVVFFSDGENPSSDTPPLVDAVQDLHSTCELLAYGEVEEAGGNPYVGDGSSVLAVLQTRCNALERLRAGKIVRANQVGDWLRAIFGAGDVA